MPFAGYKNFKDCVRKNQDKSNPEAYCSSIMRKVEGKNIEVMVDSPKPMSVQCPGGKIRSKGKGQGKGYGKGQGPIGRMGD